MIALVAVVSALAVAGTPGTAAPGALEPAPPPGICRVQPQAGWESVGLAGQPVPDISGYQDYRSALDVGPAIRGRGVRIADVEYEWRRTHVELAARGLPSSPVTGLPDWFRAKEHGTAVLGILGATVDGQGVSGLVPEAGLSAVSPYANPSGGYIPAGAIRNAAAGLGPGDVLLVELQAIHGPNLVPVEADPEVRDEIRKAVGRGIVVVEPAGNGDIDVGTVGIPWLTGPNAPNHTGALIVGAGGSPSAPSDADGTTDLRRVSGSNFGARVDLQGIGAAVVTSGYGEALGGSDDRAYTACFDGTSSASATVAGAVAALQSGAIARTGSPLSPAAVRALLVTTGLPQTGPEDGAIGPRPQVDAALDVLPDVPAPPPVDSGASTVASSSTPPRPARPAVGTARTAPAVGSVSAVIQRRAGKLVIRLKGLARAATVIVAGRRMRVVGGTVVVSRTRAGSVVLKVTAPRRARVSYSAVRVRIVVPARGAPRVVRI